VSPARLLIRNGRVIDPAQRLDRVCDLLIDGGKVRKLGRAAERAERTIDASGLIVCPGLIDMHVHLREPGNDDEETIASGAAAAVAGGFTTIACMPNTQPPLDQEAGIEFVYRQAARAGLCRVHPIGAITKGRAGRELAEMGQMVRAGAAAFSDDGVGVADAGVMFRAMQYVRMFDRAIIQHCEDLSLAAGGCMHAGPTATRLGLPSIPAMAEEVMVQRDLIIAAQTGARYHVAHVSTAGAVEAVRQAKQRGVSVTAEVCPHHLLLTDERCAGFDPNFKMNPPLRGAADVEACRAGVADGAIDCFCTDHAPHAAEEKSLEFQAAPFGVIGLETAVPLTLRAMVEPGLIDWPAWVACWTVNPARVLNLPRGTLAVGADADVTLIDPESVWTIRAEKFFSKSRNTPFDGWEVRGRPAATLVEGEVRFTTDRERFGGERALTPPP
jgi:dihydroorotase